MDKLYQSNMLADQGTFLSELRAQLEIKITSTENHMTQSKFSTIPRNEPVFVSKLSYLKYKNFKGEECLKKEK